MEVAKVELPRLPAAVGDVCARIRAGGGRAWLVGGTVRDLLRGAAPRDYDVATDLLPAAVGGMLPGSDRRDARFGVVRVSADSGPLTVTTLRRDGGYADRRHPDSVQFVADPALDAQRRDFTVNALYLDPGNGELLDPVGGRRDLDAGLLRTIGEPARRFAEDPLRLLRGLRFAASCQLRWDATSEAAARALAPALAGLSAERVYAELTQAFTGAGRGRALRELVAFGFAAHWLPEVAAMDGVPQPPEYHPEGCVLTHVCLVLDHVPADDPELAWCAVLHDIGKPPTFRRAADRIRFDGHDNLSAELADRVLQRLHASRALRELVVDVCRQHIRFAALPRMRPVRAERWLRSPTFARHLAFHRADCLGSHGDLSIHEFARAALAGLGPAGPPLVQGRDVLALGVPPGPAVGELLGRLQAAMDEAPVAWDRPTALAALEKMVVASRQDPDATAR